MNKNILTMSILSLLAACGLKWADPVTPNIAVNNLFLTPPYYSNFDRFKGEAVAFKIHLDPLIEVESLRNQELNQYLLNALPEINNYFSEKLAGDRVERYQHQWPSFPHVGLLPDSSSHSQDGKLRLFDLPKIHYGVPGNVLGPDWRRTERDPEYMKSMLTVVDGSPKWQAFFSP